MNPKYEVQPVKQMVAKITRRALKACESCRRQKTKCFPNSIDDTGSCLRCASVGRVCSFVIDSMNNNNNNNNNDNSQLSIVGEETEENDDDTKDDDSILKQPNKRRKLSNQSNDDHNEQMNSITITNTLLDNSTKLKTLNNNVKRILALLTEQSTQQQLPQQQLPQQQIQQQQRQQQHKQSHLQQLQQQQLLNLPALPNELSSIMGSPTNQQVPLAYPLPISTLRSTAQPATPSLPFSVPRPQSTPIPKPISTEAGFAPSTTSPFQLIQSSASSEFVPLTVEQLLTSSRRKPFNDKEPTNILSLGIISVDLTVDLVNNFKDNYEQWISLPRSLTTEEFIHDLRYKCPILLTSICLTSLRYDYQKTFNDDTLIKNLILRLKVELKENLTSYDDFKNLEFLKALVILCVYGHSISSSDLILDPWFLSGIAIQWFLTLDRDNSFLSLKDHDNSNSLLHQLIIDEDEEEKLSNFRIWNHICLVHLTNCIFSGRQCLVDEIRLDQSRKNLELPLATNFDGRMIGEISLQLLLYNYIQTSGATGEVKEPFENFENELKQWHKQWNYLFDQPNNLQFVEFGYHYCYVVALYHYKLGGIEDVSEEDKYISDIPILSKILYHSLKVLNPIIKLNKDQTVYFSSLSDQIHICLYYSCLVLLKTIDWLKRFDKSMTYSTKELQNFAANVETISAVYSKISRNDKDLGYKYSRGLQLAMSKLKGEKK